MFKDAAFARMYAPPGRRRRRRRRREAARRAATSYAVRARDLTIGGAFFVPNTLASLMYASGVTKDETTAMAASQLVSPPLIDLLHAPA